MYAFALTMSIICTVEAVIYFLAAIASDMNSKFVLFFMLNGGFAIWGFTSLHH
jgi:hypothetical protein